MTDKILKTNMITGEGTFNWVFVDTPKVNQLDPSKDPKYSITFCFQKNPDEGKKKLEQMNACIADALEKKFGSKKPAKFKNPIKDGDVETDPEGRARYPGQYFFEAKNSTKPGLVDADRNEIITNGAIWSGCKGKLSIGFVAYDVNGSKGVSIYLNNVMVTDTSAPKMGGKKAAVEDFADE